MKRIVLAAVLATVFSGVALAGDDYAGFDSPEFIINGIGYHTHPDGYLLVTPIDSIVVRDFVPGGDCGFRYKTGDRQYKGDVVIPDSVYVESLGRRMAVKGIGRCAFAGCMELRSVTSMGTLTYVCDRAFAYCPNLEFADLQYDDDMRIMANGVFMWCTSLKYFEIPSTVTSFYGASFMGTRIEHLTIPAGMKTIQNMACALGCNPNLRSVTCHVADPASMIVLGCSDEDFRKTYYGFSAALPEDCVLYVPEGSVAAYRADERWRCFSDIRAIGDGSSELTEATVELPVSADDAAYDLAGRRLTNARPGQVVIRRGMKSVVVR